MSFFWIYLLNISIVLFKLNLLLKIELNIILLNVMIRKYNSIPIMKYKIIKAQDPPIPNKNIKDTKMCITI